MSFASINGYYLGEARTAPVEWLSKHLRIPEDRPHPLEWEGQLIEP